MIAVRADPAQAWRTEPYERKLQYALRHGATLPPRASEAKVDTALERIFTDPDFLHSRWLVDGAKRCDAVARIVTRVEMGTGFLASLWLLVTSEPSVVAGEAFGLVLAAPAGETLPDEIDVRLKMGVEQRVFNLAASEPAVDGRRAYRGTMPAGISGPVAVDLPDLPSSVLVFMVVAAPTDSAFYGLTARSPGGQEPPH